MAWEDIVGQKRVSEALKRAVDGERVAHAYLFFGPDGVGKRAMALEFARTLQCEQGRAMACGDCAVCVKVRKMLHPDVHVYFPHPSDASTEDVAERLHRLGKNPYEELDYVRRPSLTDPQKTSNKQALYTVGRVNDEVKRAMSYKSHEGRFKIVVLIDADALRVEAANALLKFLEEPAPRSVCILTTSRIDRVLPTIISRCQQLRFDVLQTEVVAEALQQRAGLPSDRASMVARMAGGSLTRALQLVEDEQLMEHRSLVLNFFRLAYVSPTDRLIDLIETLAAMGREQVKGVLQLMLNWIRDLLLYREMGAEAPIVNVDQQTAIQRFCENVPEAHLAGMVELVEEAQELTGRNVNLTLVWFVLASEMHRAMHGNESTGLIPALVSRERSSANTVQISPM